MKTIRFTIAVVLMLSVTFMSVNRVAWAADPAQTTGGPGSTHEAAGDWFGDFPNGALPQGETFDIVLVPVTTPVVPSYPDTGHALTLLNQVRLTASTSNVGLHLVCFRTPASGGAIFWWEPTLGVWVPLANYQAYPTFDGVPYTCVNTWLMGTFAFGYIVP